MALKSDASGEQKGLETAQWSVCEARGYRVVLKNARFNLRKEILKLPSF